MARTKKYLKRFLIYLILSIAAFVSIFPCYWMFAGATNTSKDISGGRVLPGTYLMENLQKLFEDYPVWAGLMNSIKIALLSVVLSLIVTSLAAYGFEKFRTRNSEKTYIIFLIGMMIPQTSLVIPLYKMMANMGLVNTHTSIILPAVGSIFLMFFFRQNFKSFPNEMIESARIDGAGELRIFFRIVFPSMRATFAAAAIYAFMNSWNAYMWPMISLSSESKKTLILMVSKIASSSYVADYGVQMVGLAIATLPMMIVFLFLQNSFVDGLAGSVKG